MKTINIDKYKFIVNWIEDDREFNYINKKVDTRTKQIIEQKPFTINLYLSMLIVFIVY